MNSMGSEASLSELPDPLGSPSMCIMLALHFSRPDGHGRGFRIPLFFILLDSFLLFSYLSSVSLPLSPLSPLPLSPHVPSLLSSFCSCTWLVGEAKMVGHSLLATHCAQWRMEMKTTKRATNWRSVLRSACSPLWSSVSASFRLFAPRLDLSLFFSPSHRKVSSISRSPQSSVSSWSPRPGFAHTRTCNLVCPLLSGLAARRRLLGSCFLCFPPLLACLLFFFVGLPSSLIARLLAFFRGTGFHVFSPLRGHHLKTVVIPSTSRALSHACSLPLPFTVDHVHLLLDQAVALPYDFTLMFTVFLETLYCPVMNLGTDGAATQDRLLSMDSDGNVLGDEELDRVLRDLKAEWMDCKAKMLAFWQYLLVANRDGVLCCPVFAFCSQPNEQKELRSSLSTHPTQVPIFRGCCSLPRRKRARATRNSPS